MKEKNRKVHNNQLARSILRRRGVAEGNRERFFQSTLFVFEGRKRHREANAIGGGYMRGHGVHIAMIGPSACSARDSVSSSEHLDELWRSQLQVDGCIEDYSLWRWHNAIWRSFRERNPRKHVTFHRRSRLSHYLSHVIIKL